MLAGKLASIAVTFVSVFVVGVCETPASLVFATCELSSLTHNNPTSSDFSSKDEVMTVTVNSPKSTTGLDRLIDTFQKQNLLPPKNQFVSKGPVHKEIWLPVPTAPFDTDMKEADRDMYLPLLAHYPTRGFFVRLGKLLAFSIWVERDCISQTQTKNANGEVTIVTGGVNNLEGTETVILNYKSTGQCEFFRDRVKKLTTNAWSMFEFEYGYIEHLQSPIPDAVCVYVQQHGSWVEQIVMGIDKDKVHSLNCTIEGS